MLLFEFFALSLCKKLVMEVIDLDFGNTEKTSEQYSK